MNYREYNDYELIDYVHENNEEAMEIIYNKYRPLIVSYASKMYKTAKQNGVEVADLIQEGSLALNKAIKTFDDQKEASFFTYAKKCIERRIISAVTASSRLKHKFLNDSYTIDATYDDNLINYSNTLSDDTFNPEQIVMENEQISNLMEEITNILTPLEKDVFVLKTEGFSYVEIAKILKKDIKSIDNAFQRIKNKTKDIKNKIIV